MYFDSYNTLKEYMIERLLRSTVTLVTLTSAKSIPILRNAVMGNHPGLTFLEDNIEYSFPQKIMLVYNWDLLTCAMVKAEAEITV